MEKTSLEIRKQLGLKSEILWEDSKLWGKLEAGTKVEKGNIIFPRLDIQKELSKLNEANDKLIEERNKRKKGKKVEEVKNQEEQVQEITIDEFAKVQLKVAEVLACENHPKADRLYVLKLKLGEEERQVVSGIKEYYSPEDLVGKKVVVVTNLKPVKLRGVESKGMILAAEDSEGKLSLVSTLEDIASGATIS